MYMFITQKSRVEIRLCTVTGVLAPGIIKLYTESDNNIDILVQIGLKQDRTGRKLKPIKYVLHIFSFT